MRGRDFAAEEAKLTAAVDMPRDVAVVRLRELYEAWARSRLGIEAEGCLVAQVRAAVEAGMAPEIAADAAAKLQEAEQRQWIIGTWSSGAGEGLASMAEVRGLQIAQAWLWAVSPSDEARARSRALLEEADADPNGMAKHYATHVQMLYRRLKG